MARILIDSFSGPASDLRGHHRTPENVLAALRRNSRVSCWDMSEHPWLRHCIADLEKSGRIREDKAEPYPWCRYIVLPAKETNSA